MAIYKYGDITVPEIPASELPYVHVNGSENYSEVFFSSEPFIAMDIMIGIGISLMGRYGYITTAVTPVEATVEKYIFNKSDGVGWVRSRDIANYTNDVSYGGEDGKLYYGAGSMQDNGSWCNADIMWLPNTLVQQASDAPVLIKETFPIQEFVAYLMAGGQITKSMPSSENGGES